MTTVAMVSFRAPALAWTDTSDDERLFRRVTSLIVVGTFVLASVLSLSKVPKEVKADQQALAAPMAKLLLEHKPAAIIPAQPIVERPVRLADAIKESSKRERPEAKAPSQEVPRESVSKTPTPSQDTPKPTAASTNVVVNEAANQAAAVDAARRKVAGLGLLAARDDIAQVRTAAVSSSVKTDIRQAGGGQAATQSDGAALTRSLITTNSSGGSQHVNVAVSNRSVGVSGGGGGGAAGLTTTRATTQVTDELSVRAAAAVAKRAAENSGAKPKREDIGAVMARNKGALQAIVDRAARDDPSLQGKVTFEIKVAPTGAVLSCRITFSDLHAPEVEAKLLARIRMFDFGAKDVDVTTDTYTYVVGSG